MLRIPPTINLHTILGVRTSENCVKGFRSSGDTKHTLSLNRNFNPCNEIRRLPISPRSQTRVMKEDKDFAACFFDFVHFCFAETFNLAEISAGCHMNRLERRNLVLLNTNTFIFTKYLRDIYPHSTNSSTF